MRGAELNLRPRALDVVTAEYDDGPTALVHTPHYLLTDFLTRNPVSGQEKQYNS